MISPQLHYERKIDLKLTRFETLGQVSDGEILILEGTAILMIQPAKLLENLCMVGVLDYDAFICVFGMCMLRDQRTFVSHTVNGNETRID